VTLWLVGQRLQPGRKRRIGRLQSVIAGQPEVKEAERIERAWRVRRKLLDLIGREDSSATQVEDAKFEDRQGFIIEPAVSAETGKLAEAQTAGRKAR